MPLQVLGGSLQAEFEQFYERLVGGESVGIGSFAAPVTTFLDQNPADYAAHDAYFTNFGPAGIYLLQRDRISTAIRLWQASLLPVRTWEQHHGQRTHKGTVYYYLGGAHVLAGDVDTGLLFLHQALEEDRLSTGTVAPDTPALRFVTLDATGHLFGTLVQAVAAFAEARLTMYRTRGSGSVSLSDVRGKLLANDRTREIAFYMAHAFFRAHRFSAIDLQLRDTDFASLTASGILFSVYLALEEVLRRRFGDGTMHSLVVTASQHLQLRVHLADPDARRPPIEVVKANFASDPEWTLRTVLAGGPIGVTLNQIETAFALAPAMRNQSAHRLSAIPVLHERFDDVLQLGLDALFCSIECFL